MYGRFGDDLVLGNEGDDFLNGDYGSTRSAAGPATTASSRGRNEDDVTGDEGDDRINVVDGWVDRVDCGDGNDIVFADLVDVVAAELREHPALSAAI